MPLSPGGEDVGQAGLSMGLEFNASLYAYQMKNRFREFCADKVDVEHTGKSDPAKAPEMSDLEPARRVAFMLGEAVKSSRGRAHQKPT